RIVHVPSGQVFSQYQVNYNQAFSHIWNEMSVLITFESDWKKAKGLLLDIVRSDEFKISAMTEQKLREATLKFMLPFNKFEPDVFVSVSTERGVNLTIRYICSIATRRKTEVEIWERVLNEFDQHPD